MMKAVIIPFVLLALTACAQKPNSAGHTAEQKFEIEKTEEQWKEELGEQAFYVLRQHGTERAFTGKYWDHKANGTYLCGACELPLFASSTKFKSGTGWPSFWEPLNETCVATSADDSYGMQRNEVHCSRCGGHLGHVFDDGPRPTGLRYCINSVSLKFQESVK